MNIKIKNNYQKKKFILLINLIKNGKLLNTYISLNLLGII